MQEVLSTSHIEDRPVIATSQNKFFVWVLFLIWPFASFVLSVKNFRTSWARNILWAFVTFYGFTFAISSDSESSDINRYISWFHQMHSNDMSFDDFYDLLYVHEDYADVAQPLITLIVSKFTNNHFILIAVFGLIFGYLYSRNIWYLIDKIGIKNDKKVYFLLFVFALIIPFWNINGFRFWTASHLFIYGALPFIFERKKAWILIACLSPLVHYTFMLPSIILLAYFLAGNKTTIYFYFFIISMFITSLNIDAISGAIADYLPAIFTERTDGYLDEDAVTRLQEGSPDVQRNWYASFYLTAIKWSITAFLVFIYVHRKRVLTDPRFKRFYCFALLFYAFANVVSVLPSGIRFTIIANVFAAGVMVYFVNIAPNEQKMSKLFQYALPFLLIFAIVTIRLGFSTMGLVTVIGNPIAAMFVDSDVALIDVIK